MEADHLIVSIPWGSVLNPPETWALMWVCRAVAGEERDSSLRHCHAVQISRVINVGAAGK